MNDNVAFLRQQVIAAIALAEISPRPPVTAIYDDQSDLKQLSGSRLMVIPQTLEPKLADRSGRQTKTLKINIVVQYKFTAPNQAEIDPYLSLVESLSDYFMGFKFRTPVPGATPAQMRDVGAVIETSFPLGLWLHDHMRDHKVFSSVLTLTILYKN